MIVEEISNRLDTLLNKTSKGIVINEYSKSLYITKAQAYFVDHILKTYEYGDAIRHTLGKLLLEKTLTDTDVIGSGDGFKILPLEEAVKQIIYERSNDIIETIPLDYNDIHSTINSPFRKPSAKIAYRVTEDNKIKLYISESFLKYYYIYCKIPGPIILEDLPNSLNIYGIDVATTSELPNDSIIRIIEVASNLIYKDRARFFTKESAPTK